MHRMDDFEGPLLSCDRDPLHMICRSLQDMVSAHKEGVLRLWADEQFFITGLDEFLDGLRLRL